MKYGFTEATLALVALAIVLVSVLAFSEILSGLAQSQTGFVPLQNMAKPADAAGNIMLSIGG